MAYIYLFNLYDKIDFHVKEAKKNMKDKSCTLDQISYQEGRVAVLSELKQYLSESMDDKLPKRMRKKIKESK